MNSNSAATIDNKRGNTWFDVKLAVLVRNFSKSGGLELYAHKLVEGLLNHGLHVTVICEQAQTTLEFPKLHIVKVPTHKYGANKSEQIEHYFKEFSAAIDRLGPFDIVHSHHLAANHVNVVTFHNHTVFRIEECGTPVEAEINKFKLLFRRDYKRRLEMDNNLIKHADVLIFPSKVCKQDYMKHFSLSKPASLVVAYPGWEISEPADIEAGPAQVDTSENIKSSDYNKKRTIVFVGRGYRKKGLDILLSACSILKSKKYDFKLLIAGLSAKPIDRWRLYYLGLDKSVTYLGFCKHMDNVFDLASIIVAPSRVEPFGMAVLQAMSRGVVPVVSQVSGVAEILSPGKDSLLIDNHLDANKLADRLAYLLDNPELIQTLSKQAQEKAKSITWQNTVETTLGAYRQIFQKKYIV